MAVYHLSSNAYESPKWMIKEICFGSERENEPNFNCQIKAV